MKKALEMLETSAMVIPMTDAETEAAPLMPQSHGVSALARLIASFIPKGKAIPRKNPIGNVTRTATEIRTDVSSP